MSKLFNQTFNSIYAAVAEAVKAAHKPLVRRRNIRAVQSAIDSAESQGMDAEEELRKTLSVVTDGEVIDVNKVLDLRAKIKASEETMKELQEFSDEFFEKDEEEDSAKQK